jgi:hypothetical protein
MLIGLLLTLTKEIEVVTVLGSVGVFIGAALFCVMVWQVRAKALSSAQI